MNESRARAVPAPSRWLWAAVLGWLVATAAAVWTMAPFDPLRAAVCSAPRR